MGWEFKGQCVRRSRAVGCQYDVSSSCVGVTVGALEYRQTCSARFTVGHALFSGINTYNTCGLPGQWYEVEGHRVRCLGCLCNRRQQTMCLQRCVLEMSWLRKVFDDICCADVIHHSYCVSIIFNT